MTGPEFRSRHGDDEDRWLGRLLDDAVADVEPHDRLAEIRKRTGAKAGGAAGGKVHRLSDRGRWYAVGGAAAAVACVVTVVAVAVNHSDNRRPAPAATDSVASISDAPTSAASEPVERTALPLYFVGDSPQGDRLYREFQTASTNDPLVSALQRVLTGQADDPDYRSYWPAGVSVSSARVVDGVIEIDLRSGGDLQSAGDLTPRRAGMALQQLAYTAQATAGQGRLPLRVLLNGTQEPELLGIRTGPVIRHGEPLKMLNLVNLSTPSEGQIATSDSLSVSGVANSFEANVLWEIRQGDTVVDSGFATAEGWGENKLFPFETAIPIGDLAPGTYTLVASTDDPSAGEEGFGPSTDTRTFQVE